MTQKERREFLIKYLIDENRTHSELSVPEDEKEQATLLRALMNVRSPMEIGDDFLKVQDEYLKERAKEKGIISLENLSEIKDNIYLWQGDITRLQADAIVNAANSGMTGCYRQNHNCIDNCIHTFSGVQLRLKCSEIMEAQGYDEPTGTAKITPAYNLPSDYVIHTVGPIVQGKPKNTQCAELKSCYDSCLKLASEYNLESIAFCCISTGVFGFPKKDAAEIAVSTVKEYQQSHNIKVIFNVFGDEDFEIYNNLLSKGE